MVKAGDKIPNVDLDEGSPGTKVNLSKELTGKGVIIGVPAAFSEYITSVLYSLCFQCLYAFEAIVNLRLKAHIHTSGPSCSATHVPGYTGSDKLKNAGQVFVVSVNDAFV